MGQYADFIVERHRHGERGEPYTVQDRVVSVVNVQDVTGRDDSQIRVVGTPTMSNREFVAGDYVVVRDGAGVPMTWGKVSGTQSELVRSGDKLTHGAYGVDTAGWWDFLQRSAIHIMSTDIPNGRSVGTLFQIGDWLSLVGEFAASSDRLAGELMARVFRALARIRLPESLGGGFLGDEIPIVYNATTAEAFAPEYANLDPVDTGLLLPQTITPLFQQRSLSVGTALTSLFLPEPLIVEVIPALTEGGTEPYSPLANALGRRPVLVYRIKPFRTLPLSQAAVSKTYYSFEDIEAAARVVADDDERGKRLKQVAEARNTARRNNREVLITQGMFSRVSFNSADPSVVVGIPADMVSSLSRASSDSARVNATTIDIVPGGVSGIESSDTADLPIFDDGEVEKHGLRIHKSAWSFYARDSRASEAYYRSVAAQVMQFQGKAHLLETGTLGLRYARAVDAETTRPELDIRPGVWFRLKLEQVEEYYGYCTVVQHRLTQLPDGRKTAETTVRFERGHFASDLDAIMGANVPVGPAALGVGGPVWAANILRSQTGLSFQARTPEGPPPQERDGFTPKTRKDIDEYTARAFVYKGEQLATTFNVRHVPIDTSDPELFPSDYRAMRSAKPSKCVVHINGGSFTTNMTAMVNYLFKTEFAPGVGPRGNSAAHIYIDKEGTIYQVFDLAVAVRHAAEAPEWNSMSVAVEFLVPTHLTRRGRTDKEMEALHKKGLDQGYPALSKDFRFWYTDDVEARTGFREGPVGFTEWAYAPTQAQLVSFKKVAAALSFHFPIARGAVPAPHPNTTARSRSLAVRKAWFANPAWGYFHHAQLDMPRVDTMGVDLPSLLSTSPLTVL